MYLYVAYEHGVFQLIANTRGRRPLIFYTLHILYLGSFTEIHWKEFLSQNLNLKSVGI